MGVVELTGFCRFASTIDRSVCPPEVGECGGISVTVKHLRDADTGRSTASNWPVSGTDSGPETVRNDVRSYSRCETELFGGGDCLTVLSRRKEG